MKNLTLAALLLVGSSAFAHGSRAEQAADAIHAAVELFETQPADVVRQFESINATRTGHEQFAVMITLSDKATMFHYACVENESVDPVVWECQTH